MLDARPVLIMAGGTGGHVFPALAVADELRARGVPVVWLGTRAGIEARLVPDAGYPIEWLSVTGLRGKNLATLLLAPWRLTQACWQALQVIRKNRPGAVLGMGGFASGPGGLMAWLMRRPLLIHEQNAVPGLTNRLLAKIAGRILQAFPSAFGDKAATLGNPVRKTICDLPLPKNRLAQHQGRLRLLVVGGSLGAVKLNEMIPQALAKMQNDARPQVMHQTGLKNLEEAREQYRQCGVEAQVDAFIDDMATAYDWADLVICRAGAMTVFELAAAGIASILVPYPFAVDDHQTANAHYLADAGAAVIRQQSELSSDWLVETISDLMQHRERLLQMANAARALAKPDSAKQIADLCVNAGGEA
ncbi:MAG TPA: undecaprenyldiphospho-muramoylpentapeptide beta-N-acetylglucosaminyltransferase [Thiotrichales bacterium]|nr:undecaprenyldiphospho-muramoylpentapeptide beta-N-acetylglucosaminyltransferase [Thiotrichales bacterium]